MRFFMTKVVPGERAPRFHGIYWDSFDEKKAYTMLIPFNIFAGLLIQIYSFLRYGWFRICANRWEAYRQGLIDGKKRTNGENA